MSDVTIPEDYALRSEIPLDALNAAVDLCRELALTPTPASVRPIARAIIADRQRQMPGAIELYRILKANRKRKYADIAKLIAAHIGGAP